MFDLLIYLMENRDRVVSKDDLIASVWNGRIVSESTLASRINAARRAIGDSGEAQKLIRTVARRGVRFIGDVRLEDEASGQVGTSGALANRQELMRASLTRPAIAVLPFVNASGEAEQEYFSDGISEDIITSLSKLRWFTVMARNSSFAYKGKAVPMRQIADELGVGYLLEGSVRKSGERVRITAQLNDAVTGNQLWAERYDRDLADVFAVQDEIAEAIVVAVEPQLLVAENVRAQRKAPENLDAWDLLMRALSHFWRVTQEDNAAAQALLEQAVALDPNYTQAHSVLAFSHTFGAQMGWQTAASAAQVAERAARVAVLGDSEDPWSHLALACAHIYRGRLDDALSAFDTALRLNPSFSLAHGCYGLVLCYYGRWREGSEAARRALQLSPREPFGVIYFGVLAYAAFVACDYDEAILMSREAIRQRSDFAGAHRVLTAAAAMAGDIDLATVSLEELRRVQPSISMAWVEGQLPFRGEERMKFIFAMRRAGLT